MIAVHFPCKRKGGRPAQLGPAEADGGFELPLTLSNTGIVKAELLAEGHRPHSVQGYGQPPPTGHDLGLAVGVAAVADTAGKVALQTLQKSLLYVPRYMLDK